MARTKLSEYKAKVLLHEFLGLPYSGVQIKAESAEVLDELDSENKYVAKVDEGIKKRNKKGLVKINLSPREVKEYLEELKKKGYSQFIVEEMVPHEQGEEKYLSFQRVREGIQIFYSNLGGVDIEENKESIHKVLLPTSNEENSSIAEDLGVDSSVVLKLIEFFEKYYFAFIEINPLVVQGKKLFILDLAGEVDSVADFFVDGAWDTEDFTTGEVKEKTPEEEAIATSTT